MTLMEVFDSPLHWPIPTYPTGTMADDAFGVILDSCEELRGLHFTDHVEEEAAKGELGTIENQVLRLRAYIAGLRDARAPESGV